MPCIKWGFKDKIYLYRLWDKLWSLTIRTKAIIRRINAIMASNDKRSALFSDRRAALIYKCLSFLVLFVFLLHHSCRPTTITGEYKPFYFPYASLTEGAVYEYESVGADSSSSEYWFYKSLKDDQGWHLTGTYYDQYFQIRQLFREDIHPTGTIMKDYFLY